MLSAEGNQPGLAEIEAFEFSRQTTDEFIKMMDDNLDFVYDYFTEDDEVTLSLYSNLRDGMDLSEENYVLCSDNPKIACKIVDNQIRVKCPKRERGFITITEKGSGLSDTVKICNPGTVERIKCSFGQYIESKYVFPVNEKGNRNKQNIYDVVIKNLTAYRFFCRVKAMAT